MATTTLIAYDGSGSTGGCAFYHEQTQRIVGQHRDAQILFWDSSHRLISHAELAEINAARRGYGGTSSEQIAAYVKSTDFHGHLVIITDGEVSVSSVDRCAEHLGQHWKFASVTAHLIGGNVNMSVTCPFTRASPHAVFTYHPTRSYEQQLVTIVTAADLEVLHDLERITTAEEFYAQAAVLERAVIAHTMGTTGDPSLRDALLAMKKRIVRSMATAGGDSDSVKQLSLALAAHDMSAAIRAATAVTNEYYASLDSNDSEETWSGKINRLVSMCEGALRGTFDLSNIGAAIRGDRMRRADMVHTAPAADAPLSVVPETTEFVCPITLDSEHDVILLTVSEGDPILTGLDKDVVNAILDCPLNMFRYPEVVEAFQQKLDHPISLRAYKESPTPITTSPLTRRTVHGGLCLAADPQHVKATNWALSRIVAGGRKAGNLDLWYACVWILVERGALPYLAPIASQLRAHLEYRLRYSTTFLSLNGLPEFPTVSVPLSTAVWYVFASTATGALPPKRDVLRAHMMHIEELKMIVGITGYAYPPEVDHHITRLQVFFSMLSWVKKDAHAFRCRIRALHQRCVALGTAAVHETVVGRETRCDEWIPIDGRPSVSQTLTILDSLHVSYRKLSIPELVGLAALVDPKYAAGDIALPLTWSPPALPDAVVHWAYGTAAIPRQDHAICEKTCRPYYNVGGAKTWKDKAVEVYTIPVERMLSLERYYGTFVEKYGFYPSRPDLLAYIFNRCVVHGTHPTLPAQIEQFIEEVDTQYAPIRATVPADEFVRRHVASRVIEDRVKLEELA